MPGRECAGTERPQPRANSTALAGWWFLGVTALVAMGRATNGSRHAQGRRVGRFRGRCRVEMEHDQGPVSDFVVEGTSDFPCHDDGLVGSSDRGVDRDGLV